MKQQNHVDIQATPATVFAILTDGKRLAEWVEGVIENEELEMVEGITGSTFRQVYEESGRKMEFQGVVTAYELDRAMAIHMVGSCFDLDVGYRLEALEDDRGTRLIQDAVVHYKGLWKVLGFLMAPFMKKSGAKRLAEDFGRLKRLCEA